MCASRGSNDARQAPDLRPITPHTAQNRAHAACHGTNATAHAGQQLDFSIVNVARPSIRTELDVCPFGPPEPARALLENLRSALPGTTIIAAIHDRTLDQLPVPADAAVRLAAGRILRVT